jgi:competence protein ComEC
MTLVAGIIFVVTRRLLALSPTLALAYPIKKWAAVVAMAGALLYDVATGSRVGTERALIMTLIVLGAVIMDRRALTMRNLGFAVLAVVAIEPEAILGVSFQLSFAAVAALVAVMEARIAIRDVDPDPFVPKRGDGPKRGFLAAHLVERPLALLIATAFATSATASFMAYHFHDLSPYVLIGNPLTLTIIEFFAVPGALIGAALYPLGLDAPGLALCRGGDQVHPVGSALHRRRPRLDLALAGVRTLRPAVSGHLRDQRHRLADLDLPVDRRSARTRRGRRRAPRASL